MELTTAETQSPYIPPIPGHFQVIDLTRALAIQLRISQRCLATAQTYLLKIRRSESLLAAASIFLASKTLEQPRSLHTISSTYYSIHTKNLQTRHPKLVVPPLSAYTRNGLETQLKKLQFEILEQIGFNCIVDLPYDYLDKFQWYGIQSEKLNDLKKTAACYANDSFRTSVALWWTGEEVAKTCLVLAAEFLGLDLDLTCSRQVYEVLRGLYFNQSLSYTGFGRVLLGLGRLVFVVVGFPVCFIIILLEIGIILGLY